MKQPPKEIYLQLGEDDEKAVEWFDGATWCQDKINDTDVKYIRADLVVIPLTKVEKYREV